MGNNIPIEDEPAELSPDNYACQDRELPLVKHLDAEKSINLQGENAMEDFAHSVTVQQRPKATLPGSPSRWRTQDSV